MYCLLSSDPVCSGDFLRSWFKIKGWYLERINPSSFYLEMSSLYLSEPIYFMHFEFLYIYGSGDFLGSWFLPQFYIQLVYKATLSFTLHICHHFWVGLLLHPPKSDEKNVQLPRVSFVKKQLLAKSAF